MKKLTLLSSLLVVLALLLAACGGTTPTQSSDGALLTPDMTEVPGGVDVATPVATEAVTMEATAEATTEATVEEVVPTVDATATMESTDVAVEPGVNENFVLLSDLLAMTVNHQDGTQVGTVDGVVIDRSAFLTGETTTGDAASTDASNPRVSYLRIQLDDAAAASTGGVLVPFAAVAASDMDTTAADDSAATGERALTLNIDETALTGAPAFAGDVAGAGWDADLSTYWAGQGLTIPVTGDEAAVANSSVLVEDAMLGDLKVTGADDAALGNVNDFVVDMTTGEILYGVLSGGDTFGSSYYAVPFRNLGWRVTDGGMGTFSFNGDVTSFSSAPSFTTLDDFHSSNFSDIDSYWEGLTMP